MARSLRRSGLVLTDRTPITAVCRVASSARGPGVFADPGTRRDHLLAGFGWCHMPVHMVREDIAANRLKALELRENVSHDFPIHVVHQRSRLPGQAGGGRWLIEDLSEQAKACTVPLAAPAAKV